MLHLKFKKPKKIFIEPFTLQQLYPFQIRFQTLLIPFLNLYPFQRILLS